MEKDWLQNWADNVEFIDIDDLAKKVFKEVMSKHTDVNFHFGPNEDKSEFLITANNDIKVTIPLPDNGK